MHAKGGGVKFSQEIEVEQKCGSGHKNIWKQQSFKSMGMVFVFNIIDMQVTTISEAYQQEEHKFKSNDEGSQ